MNNKFVLYLYKSIAEPFDAELKSCDGNYPDNFLTKEIIDTDQQTHDIENEAEVHISRCK